MYKKEPIEESQKKEREVEAQSEEKNLSNYCKIQLADNMGRG